MNWKNHFLRNLYFYYFFFLKKLRFFRNSTSTMTAEHRCGLKNWGLHYTDTIQDSAPHRYSAAPSFFFFFGLKKYVDVPWNSHPLDRCQFFAGPKIEFESWNFSDDKKKKKRLDRKTPVRTSVWGRISVVRTSVFGTALVFYGCDRNQISHKRGFFLEKC